ncbi:MAG: carbon-nitrogen hydrolase [Pirellulales bacterium]|jgi:N-carbamoylputrescine amidase|nr:carbon-nitrogen hydrolase [Thermoguttaceae bacterium]MDD4788271.1 carbon-nitrogen hydrolase [Pirellulales bacterium]MDI9446539.1 carbon-nitrogen hydrolase [Planctomycetota bacterium]NLZ03025.1 carbon-nitrogen hydrolase [Pirellulaceae bacterium]
MSPDAARQPREGKVKLALVQCRAAATKDENVARTLDRIGAAAAAGADIVCLAELFAGPYPCQAEDHRRFDDAEPIPGPTSRALAEAARRHAVVVIGSLFERRAAGLYHNTAAVYDVDGTTAGIYRKMHIPDDPLYYEKFYFTPGDLGFPAFDTQRGRIAVGVCWDQWFPEAARLFALAGAQIIVYPTAIGWLPGEKAEFGPSQHDAWQTVIRSHAIANGLFVAAVNRTGVEGGLEFWGASFAADPHGNLRALAGHAGEETLLVDCDLDQIDAVRTHWPFLRDRRIDAYEGLLRRFLD